ncbi:MAG: prepilin-type N-terminal cleavage/methylation domain-containing protein [Candidatus Pacebacteria bacterium]|nr:prepilin-type N-terminal cleavage/methylation domain-containing protein [Candidatus Paceibacterota bacterium]
MQLKLNQTKNNKGFTLIELLVVIAIIGILSSVVIASLNTARQRARTARAQADLKQFQLAIGLLYDDTSLHPRKLTLSPCVQDPEVYLNSSAAGIQSTDGGFPGWDGPYMGSVPLDPWGTNYYFDPDLRCTDQKGCEGISSGTMVRGIQSFGPNKAQNYGPGSDDIVIVLCAP